MNYIQTVQGIIVICLLYRSTDAYIRILLSMRIHFDLSNNGSFHRNRPFCHTTARQDTLLSEKYGIEYSNEPHQPVTSRIVIISFDSIVPLNNYIFNCIQLIIIYCLTDGNHGIYLTSFGAHFSSFEFVLNANACLLI